MPYIVQYYRGLWRVRTVSGITVRTFGRHQRALAYEMAQELNALH